MYLSAPGDGIEPAAEGTSVFSGGFLSPVMVLHESALAHNIAEMARFCSEQGVEFAPHAKTTMSPELISRQLDAGAWGVSMATPGQVRAARAFGVRNVLLANELVDPAGIDWIAGDLRANPDHGFLCYVDSVAGARALADRLPVSVWMC